MGIYPNTADVHSQIYFCKNKCAKNLPMCVWTLLKNPTPRIQAYWIKRVKEEDHLLVLKFYCNKPNIFTIYTNVETTKKYKKKKNHKMQNQETSSLQTPLLYKGLKVNWIVRNRKVSSQLAKAGQTGSTLLLYPTLMASVWLWRPKLDRWMSNDRLVAFSL